MDQDDDKTNPAAIHRVQTEQPQMLGLYETIPKLNKPWWRYPELLRLNCGLLSALLASAAVGYDSSMLNGLQAVPAWTEYFHHPKGATLGAMSNGITFGILFSLFFTFWLCEHFGRRWPLWGGSGLLIVGTVIQTASQTYSMFVVSRFIAGIGIGIISVVSLLLLAEVTYPSHRAVMTALTAVFWPVGALIAAGVTYGTFRMESTWAWRLPSLIQGVLPFFQIALLFLVPESPRWLVDQGRHEEARQVLVKFHGLGDPSSRLVQTELAEISAAIEIEKMSRTSRWKDWISTQGNIYRLCLILFLGFVRQLQGNALVSYYLTLILQSVGIKSSNSILIVNVCLQIWSTITCTIFATSVEKIGRRRQVLISIVIMLCAFFIWTILSQQAASGNYKNPSLSGGVLAMIFIFQMGSQFFAPAVQTAVMEIPQYSLRSKASTLFNLTQNAAGLFSGFVNPIAMDSIGWRYYIVYVVLLAFDLVVFYFYLPETKQLGLEEVATIFDGENAIISWRGIKKLSQKERMEAAGNYMARSALQKGIVEHEELA